RHTRSKRDWSSDVCSSDLSGPKAAAKAVWKRWVSAISGAGMHPRVIGRRATGDSPLPTAGPGAYAGGMRSVLSLILNIIWLLTAGWALFLSYLLAGVIACLLVVTIPFGIASFRIAGFVIWPFGREVVDTGRGGAGSALGNVI